MLRFYPLEIDALRAQAQTSQAAFAQRFTEIATRTEQVIVSPVTGRVAALPMERGQTAGVGSVVSVIIPDGAALVADLYVPTRAVGFIQPGQDVQLMIDAFPHQRFGTGRGTIERVSRTVLAPAEVAIPGLNLQEPVFRARVALSRETMEAYGEDLSLQPGMLLQADIIIDRRTLIEWLLDPLYAAGRRA